MTDQNSDAGAGGGDAAAAATAAAAAAAGGGGQAGAEQPWYSSLADDLKADPLVTRYAKPEDAARALIHFQGLQGVPDNQLLRLPKPDDAAGNEALWNKLGRPETADKYQVEVKEGSALDKDATAAFLAHMHKAGPMTAPMAKAAMDWYQGYAEQVAGQAVEADKQATTAAETALKGEWGDAYKQNLDAAAAAALQYGGPELQKYLADSGMGNDPRMLKAWLKVAEAGREAGPVPKDPGRDQGAIFTPAQAKAELAAMESDPKIKGALLNANDPNNEYYTQRRLQLIGWSRAAG